MNNDLYPLTLEPVMAEQWRHARWGSLYGDETAREFTRGLIRLADDTIRVAAGPLAGRTLGHLRQRWGADLVGSTAAGEPDAPFPLEMKLWRTGDAPVAVALNGPSLWFILSATTGSVLQAGFKSDLDLRAIALKTGGDPGRWAAHLPAYPAAEQSCLSLPPYAPLLLGAGLDVLQISPPAALLPVWPLDGADAVSVSRAAESEPPRWLNFREQDGSLVYDSENPRLTLVDASLKRCVLSPEATTIIWPRLGQGRLRTQGPAPATRLQPGRALAVPAGLGRFTIESGAKISCLIVESV